MTSKTQDKPTSTSAPIDNDEFFILLDCELETLRRAAVARSLPFDPQRRRYTRSELAHFGMVREGYTRDELRALGFGLGPVSCFDAAAKAAENLLKIDTPFGSGIQKWQLPFDMMPIRIMKTIFPQKTKVERHVHPAGSLEDPGGGLRIVTEGRIFFEGREYGPGDWFYVPNGKSYSFMTDPDKPTTCFYKYAFFGWNEGNRFSHPHGVDDGTHTKSI